MSDKIDVKAVMARADKTPKAPWRFSSQIGVPIHCDVAQVWTKEVAALCEIDPLPDENDATAIAEFIAHARSDIPALCHAYDEQVKEIERLRNVSSEITVELLNVKAENERLRGLLKEAQREISHISSNKYGLQSILEDYPDYTQERAEKICDYYHALCDAYQNRARTLSKKLAKELEK